MRRLIKTLLFLVLSWGIVFSAHAVSINLEIEQTGSNDSDIQQMFAADMDNGIGAVQDDVPVPVAEPDTLLLFGFGMAGLAAFVRRRITKKTNKA